jgi:predicted alpha/beta hydrolase family esterase
MKRAIIVHGWGGSPKRDFLPWLKEELDKKGYEVITPVMPETNNPKIEKWVTYLAANIGGIREDDILIGHSMGCQTILRFLEGLSKSKKVRKVILVAGFGPFLKGLTKEEWQIVQPWVDASLDLDKIKTKADKFIAIFSDNDPFVPLIENRKLFEEKLGAKVLVEHNKGHFNKMPKERPDLLTFI